MIPEELLQKYLDRTLNAPELDEFNILYSNNAIFKQKIDQSKDLIKGIRLAEVSKIRSEVQGIHHEVISGINDTLAFESSLSKALRYKQKENIKNEILQVKTEMMKMQENSKNESSQPMGVSRNIYKIVAMAASVLLIISLSIFLITKNDKVDTESLGKVYNIIKLGSQSAGIADPNQSINLHQQHVFELLDQNKMDSARIVQDTYYTNQAKNADYFVLNGLIYFKAGKNALAKKSFNEGVKHGDQCLSKLLLALMNDKGITATNEIVLNIKSNAACQASELVTSILKELKW